MIVNLVHNLTAQNYGEHFLRFMNFVDNLTATSYGDPACDL